MWVSDDNGRQANNRKISQINLFQQQVFWLKLWLKERWYDVLDGVVIMHTNNILLFILKTFSHMHI